MSVHVASELRLLLLVVLPFVAPVFVAILFVSSLFAAQVLPWPDCAVLLCCWALISCGACIFCAFVRISWFCFFQELYERYEATEGLSRRTMKARLLWDAILESQVRRERDTS